MLITEYTRILTGQLEKGLKNEIFEWGVINQKSLIQYWKDEISTIV